MALPYRQTASQSPISGIARNEQLIRLRNHPLDNATLIESWRQKGLS
jgi:hypothetical protein